MIALLTFVLLFTAGTRVGTSLAHRRCSAAA